MEERPSGYETESESNPGDLKGIYGHLITKTQTYFFYSENQIVFFVDEDDVAWLDEDDKIDLNDKESKDEWENYFDLENGGKSFKLLCHALTGKQVMGCI